MKALRALLSLIVGISLSIHARAEIKARGSDSTLHVLKALASGEVTLAFLSRDLNDAEKKSGLIGFAYAKDGVAIVVHPSNAVAGLTMAELRDIYDGKTVAWADEKPVVAFNRNLDSGTREVFQERVLGKDAFSPKAAVKHDGVLISSVEKIPSAIAYTSLAEADETKVRIVPVAGVKPTPASLRDGSYPISRTPTLATRGEPAGDEKAFISFVLGPKGQAIVSKTGLVAVK